MAQFSNALRPVFSFFFSFFFFLPPGSAVFNRGINQPEYGRWSWSWSTASAIDRGLSTPNKDISLRDTKSVRFSRLLLAFTSYPRTFLVSSYVSCRHSLAIWNSFFVHNDPSLGRKIKGSRKWNQRDSREKNACSRLRFRWNNFVSARLRYPTKGESFDDWRRSLFAKSVDERRTAK